MLLCCGVRADQYQSEVRELDTPPAQAQQKSTQDLLKSTTDPYGKALLLRDLAGAAVQKKDYKEAARLLEQALAQNALSGPAADAMRKDLTALTMASGNFKQMLPQLEALVKSGKAPPETLVALGAAYVENKRYKDAIPLLEKGLAAVKQPDPSWKRALLAAYLGAGREAQAQPLLEQVVREDPTQKDDWTRLAAVTLKSGNKERAQAVLEVASRLGYLDTPQDRLRLVTLTGQLGAPFEAGSLLKGWLDSGALPKNADNAKLLAALWVNARESGLALPALEAAIKLAPSAALYQQIAQLRMDREEYGDAARALEQAIALSARSGPVLMTLGTARYQQADIEGAIAAFREAAAFEPSRKLAAEWVKYLESGKAREQAMIAAAERRQRGGDVATLSSRLLGGAVTMSGDTASAGDIASTGTAGGDGVLTAVGAEARGNATGTIPAWSGGLTSPPGGYKRGQRLVDPYAVDKPLYTITPANAAQYTAQLSSGHQLLLKKFSDYKMQVYPSRRSVAYPQAIYDTTQANIGKAKLLGSDALSGARIGFPFPRPQNGVEILWNHRVRYRGNSTLLQSSQAVVAPDGDAQFLKQTERVFYRYANLKDAIDLTQRNILLYYLTWFGKSRSSVDFLALVHETANSKEDSRGVWVLPPGLGRMFRLPPVGYDQPFPGSDGLYFIDMVDMYNGAFDRYVWKLQGKRELLLPYNSYRLSDGSHKYAELLKPGHLNQEFARYELHRVWVVEATERGGKSHSFGKRIFYVDEDSWNVVLVENYDRDDRTLWRFQEGHLLALYDAQTANALPVVTYDFKDGRYFINRLIAEDGPAQYDLPDMKESDFLPANVKARYAR